MQCKICRETDNLIAARVISNGKEEKWYLCQNHFILSKFDRWEEEIQVRKEEEWRNTKCCATQINPNGHCTVCGDYAL